MSTTARNVRLLLLTAGITAPLFALASSHREAPAIGGMPRVDATDLYLFRSYEANRAGFVTVIANYVSLQDPSGGPFFHPLDNTALYEIHFDNNGDAQPDMTFQFRFTNTYKNLAVPAGAASGNVAVPLINTGPVDAAAANLNLVQTYSVNLVRGNRRTGASSAVVNASGGSATFTKPSDNIGVKSIPNYGTYANGFIYGVTIPGCTTAGRVFVGQRKDPFVVNVGGIFDLVNLNPVGPRNGEPNGLANKNVTSLALELPISCLTAGTDPVIGAWTTASLRQARVLNPKPSNPNAATIQGGAWTQVSRLGQPLVNEVVIGVPDKDKFNASEPKDDAQFLTYVTNPTLPVLLNTLFGNAARTPATPRNDLVTVFLTGVPALNKPATSTPSEMLRLNTSTAVTPIQSQNDLGVLGGDNAGFPNGRRPVDDVVDIELRAAEGALCGVAGACGPAPGAADPNAGAPYTDGARAAGPTTATSSVSGAQLATDTYLDVFPYLNTPIAGAPVLR